MQHIVSSATDARSRTVVCSLYQEDGKTPYAGSLSGVKMNFAANQAGGATLTSNADVARVAAGSAKVFVTLTQLESATFAPNDRVTAWVAASAGNYLRWEEDLLVMTGEVTGAPLNPNLVADATVRLQGRVVEAADGSEVQIPFSTGTETWTRTPSSVTTRTRQLTPP